MNSLQALANAFASFAQSALPLGLSILIQSTLLLLLGLLAGRVLQRYGPALPSLLYRATLIAIVVSALLCVLLAGRIRPVWQVTVTHPPVPLPNRTNGKACPR